MTTAMEVVFCKKFRKTRGGRLISNLILNYQDFQFEFSLFQRNNLKFTVHLSG